MTGSRITLQLGFLKRSSSISKMKVPEFSIAVRRGFGPFAQESTSRSQTVCAQADKYHYSARVVN
jgi:hypothetical protein